MIRWLVIAALSVLGTTPALAGDGCGGKGVVLQVLGSGAADPDGERAGSSYLVWIDGHARILVNTGHGSALRFARSGALFSDLDVILFTGLGASNTVELPAFIEASASWPRSRPLPVYGPPSGRGMPSTIGLIRDLLDNTRGTYRHLGEFISPIDKSTYKLQPHDVRPPAPKLAAPRRAPPMPLPVFQNERLQIQAVPVVRDKVPTLSFRVDAGDRSMMLVLHGYSQDLVSVAPRSGLLVVPGTWTGNSGDEWISPAQAGELAAAAQARQVVISQRHRGAAGHDEEFRAGMRQHYKGTIEMADDLACYRF